MKNQQFFIFEKFHFNSGAICTELTSNGFVESSFLLVIVFKINSPGVRLTNHELFIIYLCAFMLRFFKRNKQLFIYSHTHTHTHKKRFELLVIWVEYFRMLNTLMSNCVNLSAHRPWMLYCRLCSKQTVCFENMPKSHNAFVQTKFSKKKGLNIWFSWL